MMMITKKMHLLTISRTQKVYVCEHHAILHYKLTHVFIRTDDDATNKQEVMRKEKSQENGTRTRNITCLESAAYRYNTKKPESSTTAVIIIPLF